MEGRQGVTYQLREFSDGLGELMVRTATTMHAALRSAAHALSSCVRACVRACVPSTTPQHAQDHDNQFGRTKVCTKLPLPSILPTHTTPNPNTHTCGISPTLSRSTTQHHAAPRNIMQHYTTTVGTNATTQTAD